ncbi:hypothetical protein KKC74_01205 [bacterium]|nr:hypothetical protein [bacterium]MBU1873319.1 hypothetical protein [bacterium]
MPIIRCFGHWDLNIAPPGAPDGGYCLVFDIWCLEIGSLILFACPVGSMRPYQGYLMLVSKETPVGGICSKGAPSGVLYKMWAMFSDGVIVEWEEENEKLK